MPNTRILIVDSEPFSRNQLRKLFGRFSNIEIVGSISNCRLALMKIPQVNPDIVVMDVNMPETDVIQTVIEIRKSYPDLPVFMLCARNENKNAARVLEAMAAGANDYLPKTCSLSKEFYEQNEFREEILAKIRPFCTSPIKRKKNNSIAGSQNLLPQEESPDSSEKCSPKLRSLYKSSEEEKTHRIDILAIGVSTGGPKALVDLLSGFAYDFPVPIVIVQHMPLKFTEILAGRLNMKTSLSVTEAKDGVLLAPRKVFLAPGGKHMSIRRELGQLKIHTSLGPPENSCRPAVDVLFRSVAECYGRHSLAVVLTGMGQDGLLGAKKIRASGGKIFVQDKQSSVVWGMPGALVRANLADKVLPLEKMSKVISQNVWLGRPYPSSHTPVEFSA